MEHVRVEQEQEEILDPAVKIGRRATAQEEGDGGGRGGSGRGGGGRGGGRGDVQMAWGEQRALVHPLDT